MSLSSKLRQVTNTHYRLSTLCVIKPALLALSVSTAGPKEDSSKLSSLEAKVQRRQLIKQQWEKVKCLYVNHILTLHLFNMSFFSLFHSLCISTHSFIHSLTHSLIYLPIHKFTYLITNPLIRLFTVS